MKFISPINVLSLVVLMSGGSQHTASGFAPSFLPSRVSSSGAPTSPSFLPSVASSSSEDATTEIIDLGDDDDDEITVDTRTYTDYSNELSELLLSKKDRDVSPDMELIFDDMLQAYVISDEDASLWPNVTIYNMLLEAHAWSPNSNGGGDKAQHILDRMEDLTVETVARPNVLSYMTAMDAWGNRNEPEKAKAILDRMMARFEQTASEDVKPDTKVYNKLIGAWMKSDAKDNAEQAEAILKTMMDQYEVDGTLLPNQKSFVQVMRCYGNRQNLPKVKELFDTIKSLYLQSGGDDTIQPDTQVYNELISCIAKDRENEKSAQDAEAVLYEMMEAANMGNDAMEPNAATFRNVIYGYKRNTDPAVAYKAEKLLELATVTCGDDVKTSTYNAAIQVISWTREPEKAALCWKLVQRMSENDNMAPTKASYNNVLNACAHTFNPKDPKEIFRIAIEAFNELRASDYHPDVTTYGHLLRCCSMLLPDNNSDKRDSVVKNIFMKCTNDGMVGRYVLSEVMEAASPALVADLLGGKPEDGVKIPRPWSRHVKDGRQRLR